MSSVTDPLFRSLRTLLREAIENEMWESVELYSRSLIRRGFELTLERKYNGKKT